jgi:hypothetical protein
MQETRWFRLSMGIVLAVVVAVFYGSFVLSPRFNLAAWVSPSPTALPHPGEWWRSGLTPDPEDVAPAPVPGPWPLDTHLRPQQGRRVEAMPLCFYVRDVKDGWVRYLQSQSYPDERGTVRDFTRYKRLVSANECVGSQAADFLHCPDGSVLRGVGDDHQPQCTGGGQEHGTQAVPQPDDGKHAQVAATRPGLEAIERRLLPMIRMGDSAVAHVSCHVETADAPDTLLVIGPQALYTCEVYDGRAVQIAQATCTTLPGSSPADQWVCKTVPVHPEGRSDGEEKGTQEIPQPGEWWMMRGEIQQGSEQRIGGSLGAPLCQYIRAVAADEVRGYQNVATPDDRTRLALFLRLFRQASLDECATSLAAADLRCPSGTVLQGVDDDDQPVCRPSLSHAQ